MIVRIFKKSNKGRINRKHVVDPDEIFLDSHNIQNFDQQQFEGRIEKPIPKQTIGILGLCFLFLCIIFLGRLGYLQVKKGEAYLERSENNIIEETKLFADRGIIYDRNKKELAWNQKIENLSAPLEPEKLDDYEANASMLSLRKYKSPGFSHLLGYVSYPTKDSKGNFWQSEFVGKDGLEKQYNERIKGENGSKMIETDAQGNIHSENIVNTPMRGEDLVTTIDSGIQAELYAQIKSISDGYNFSGGAGVIIDVRSGEVLTSTSYPEYDSEVLSIGKDSEAIKEYMNDKRKVFLDRNISGLYTPGSIVKPIFAVAALNEGIIDPEKELLSQGSISIPNPYFPDQKSVFKDWKVHGWVDMRRAIAVSSDTYFYEIGGGFEDQKGLGIARLEKYSKLFGIGEKSGVDLPDENSGVIPSPEWKQKFFKGDIWRVGDTYHTSIGQYGYQVTPMEMVRAIAAVANRGTLVTPHFVLGDKELETKVTKVDITEDKFNIAREGMREAVTYGTAVGLNVPYVDIAAKTGTAQLGLSKTKVNSWVVGFFPYQEPKYAFVVMMEAGPSKGSVNATVVMRGLLDWMSYNTPEYFK